MDHDCDRFSQIIDNRRSTTATVRVVPRVLMCQFKGVDSVLGSDKPHIHFKRELAQQVDPAFLKPIDAREAVPSHGIWLNSQIGCQNHTRDLAFNCPILKNTLHQRPDMLRDYGECQVDRLDGAV